MSDLAAKQCIPCSGSVPSLPEHRIKDRHREIPQWQVVEGHHLSREFFFADFVSALAFVNRVGEVAESEAHHPDIHLAWGKARIEIWTHKIDGLTESDFIFAAKVDQLS